MDGDRADVAVQRASLVYALHGFRLTIMESDVSTRDEDRPAWDPYDPLKRDLPSDTLGSGYGTVQGLRYGRATRGMGYGPQTGSAGFGVYGAPPRYEPSHTAPHSLAGGSGTVGSSVRYAGNRDAQSRSSHYAGLADDRAPATLAPLEDMMFEQRYRSSSGPPRSMRRHYPRTDARIRDDVAERLYRSAHVDPGEVSVEVSDGVVTLEGSASSRRMKHDIEDLAADTPGVKDVENRIRVGAGASDSASSTRGAVPEVNAERQLHTPQHEEWLLDEGVEESFPASDTPSSIQPGSIAAREQSDRS